MSSEIPSNESAGLLQADNDVEAGQASASEELPSVLSADRTNINTNATSQQQDHHVTHQYHRPSFIFLFFRFHNLVGIFSLLLMAMAQGFPSPHRKLELISVLQEFYILLACAIGAITELELSQWLIDRVAPVMKDWLARGAFYLFLAVIATEESTIDVGDDTNTNIHKDDGLTWAGQRLTSLILNIAAGGLFVSGCLYVIMGLFCLKGLKERCERENDERLTRIIQGQSSQR